MAAFVDNVSDSTATCTFIMPLATSASNYTGRIRLVVPIIFIMPPMPYIGAAEARIPPWLDPDSKEAKRRRMNARTRASWTFIKEPEKFYQQFYQQPKARTRLPLGISRQEKRRRYVQGLRRGRNAVHC